MVRTAAGGVSGIEGVAGLCTFTAVTARRVHTDGVDARSAILTTLVHVYTLTHCLLYTSDAADE